MKLWYVKNWGESPLPLAPSICVLQLYPISYTLDRKWVKLFYLQLCKFNWCLFSLQLFWMHCDNLAPPPVFCLIRHACLNMQQKRSWKQTNQLVPDGSHWDNLCFAQKLTVVQLTAQKLTVVQLTAVQFALNNVRSLLSSNVKDSHSLYEVKWRTVSDILQSIGQLISTCISNISVLRHNTTFACYFVLWCEMALIECDTVLICVRWCEKFLLMFLQIFFWNDVVRAITCKL